MCDSIILDDLCLRNGLPPLSMGRSAAANMICEMNSEQKRKVLRKIRKLTKTEISRRCHLVKNRNKRILLRQSLERQTNLASVNKQPHQHYFTRKRLLLIKQYFETMVIRENKTCL